MHAIWAPGLPSLDNDLGVALGSEDMALGLKLGPQGLEVVNLAIEDDAHLAVGRKEWLLAGGQVDDRQAPMPQGKAGFQMDVVFIGAAVGLYVVDATRQIGVERAHTAQVKKAGDTACLLYTSPSPRD